MVTQLNPFAAATGPVCRRIPLRRQSPFVQLFHPHVCGGGGGLQERCSSPVSLWQLRRVLSGFTLRAWVSTRDHMNNLKMKKQARSRLTERGVTALWRHRGQRQAAGIRRLKKKRKKEKSAQQHDGGGGGDNFKVCSGTPPPHARAHTQLWNVTPGMLLTASFHWRRPTAASCLALQQSLAG